MHAARNGHDEVLNILVKAGAQLNLRDLRVSL